MKAAILDTLGAPPRYGDFAEPEALPGETIVTVRAAAIKQLDRAIVAGRHYSSPKPEALPIVPGQDGIGVSADGTRGYFLANRRPFGAMAERVPVRWLAPVPDAIDDATAAAIVNPALAAWLPLAWRAELQPGETVLVLGATGAAGGFAVRAARLLGAGRVIAAGRNPAVLAALDADATIDLTLAGDDLVAAFRALGQIDVVIDYVWGPPVEALLKALTNAHTDVAAGSNRGTRIVTLGEMAGSHASLPSGVFRSSRLKLLGSGTGNFPPEQRMRDMIADIFASTLRGDIAISTDACPLAQVSDAWSLAASSDSRIVLLP